MKFRPYPEYKKSGMQWLGDIPVHWVARRLKHVSLLFYGDTLISGERKIGNISVYGSNGRVGTHTTANTNAPCIVVGRKGSFGKINYSTMPAFAIDTTYFIDDRATKENIRWLFYALLSINLDAISKDSAVPGLQRNDAYHRIIPTPPLAEQDSIARFLDWATAKIDGAIAAKEKVIALLSEQKKAIVHHAITRGLDSSAALKPSGVPWLGDIPKHWDVLPLKYCVNKFYSGGTPDSGNADYYCDFGEGTPWLMISDMTGQRHVYRTQKAITSKGKNSKKLDVLPAGVILISMYASIGTAALLKIDAAVNQAILGMRFDDKKLQTDYGLYCLECMQPCIAYFSDSSTQANLNSKKVRDFPIIIPPISEQKYIVKHLNDKTAKIAAAAECARREIALLREYRARLVADAVTGKIDVRGITLKNDKKRI